MTPEERFECVEHVIGGLQFAIDRTRRPLDESMIEHDRQRREERADRMQRDRRIDDRIEKLVGAIGAFISR